MPQPGDAAKALYELVNYSRYFGKPSLKVIAGLLKLSQQQLQRRIQALGFNFSSVVGYVLNNIATRYLLQGYQPEEISRLLGYTNPQSFTNAFRRVRGCTPTQYARKLEE